MTVTQNPNSFCSSQVDLSALVPGDFGKLGDPLPMSVGVKESSAFLAIQTPPQAETPGVQRGCEGQGADPRGLTGRTGGQQVRAKSAE